MRHAARRENHVVISMTLFHQRYRKHIAVENARPGEMGRPTLQGHAHHRLVMTPEANRSSFPFARTGRGLREGDGGAHLSLLSPTAPYSSSFIHEETGSTSIPCKREECRADLSLRDQEPQLKPVKTC